MIREHLDKIQALLKATFDYPVWLGVVVLLGAVVGSFLNVVIHRLPEGKRMWKPLGSHCPHCGHKIMALDNMPVFGWLWLLGRCRYCKIWISMRYPLIELLCTVLFAGLFWCYFESSVIRDWFNTGIQLSSLRPEFFRLGPLDTWPVLLVHLVLVACLLAATMIDLQHYLIPLSVTWFPIIIGGLTLPVASHFLKEAWQDPISKTFLVPTVPPMWLGPLAGAVVGLLIAQGLLMLRLLPRSFADLEVEAPAEGGPAAGTPDEWLAYPHPRREVLKECLFLLFPIAGLAAGYKWPMTPAWFGIEAFPVPALVAGGMVAGYLVGGFVVWATRIGGTLLFGKEAMGLGDVHLLAGIGAILGWRDSAVIFLLAPFLALALILPLMIGSALARKPVRVIPYGPFLALAAVLWMVGERLLERMPPFASLLGLSFPDIL